MLLVFGNDVEVKTDNELVIRYCTENDIHYSRITPVQIDEPAEEPTQAAEPAQAEEPAQVEEPAQETPVVQERARRCRICRNRVPESQLIRLDDIYICQECNSFLTDEARNQFINDSWDLDDLADFIDDARNNQHNQPVHEPLVNPNDFRAAFNAARSHRFH